MPNFLFGFFNFFSGQHLYELIQMQFYNTTSTFFPIFFYGIFDQKYKKQVYLSNEKLYEKGLNRRYFSKSKLVV